MKDIQTHTAYIEIAIRRRGALTDGRVIQTYIGGDLSVACQAIMDEGDFDLVFLIDPETDTLVWKQERGRASVGSVLPSSTS